MEETIEEFNKAAIEEFGDKFYIGKLNLNDETLNELNKQYNETLTQKDFDEYGEQVWLKEAKCPKCGKDLLGLFGTFEWSLQHGYGHCSHCNAVEFKYYHHIRPNYTLRMMALAGF